MQAIRKLTVFFLLAGSLASARGIADSADSLRYEVLLTPSMVDEIDPATRLINSIDITSNHLILLSTRDQFFLLGWGGIIPSGKKVTGNIGSFAFTPDSLLMTIRNDELCIFDDKGDLKKFYSIPSSEMGISRGKYAMYLFDRNGSKPVQGVYVLAHGGKYSRLFQVPKPIYSLVEYGSNILFTNLNTIYEYSIEKKSMKAIASLPEGMTIRSLTVDPQSGRIYFSTDNMVLSLKGTEQKVVTDKLGGKLMFYDGLIVFNPEKKILVRIGGIEKVIVSEAKPVSAVKEIPAGSDILTNESVIGFVKDKLSDGVIINIIRRSKVKFDLSVDAMIDLSDQNVSSAVIMAMKEAMKKQSEK